MKTPRFTGDENHQPRNQLREFRELLSPHRCFICPTLPPKPGLWKWLALLQPTEKGTRDRLRLQSGQRMASGHFGLQEPDHELRHPPAKNCPSTGKGDQALCQSGSGNYETQLPLLQALGRRHSAISVASPGALDPTITQLTRAQTLITISRAFEVKWSILHLGLEFPPKL